MAVERSTDEYRRVIMTGRWRKEPAALVQALTERGGGYWVMAPFGRDDGTTVIVNRGFVSTEQRFEAVWAPQDVARVTVTGLLRISEGSGAFLRANDPSTDRWYSRDVAAIAASRGLTRVAPYFVDVDRARTEAGVPVGGMTVVSFSNNHLAYAVTWAVLALMALAGAVFVNFDILRPSLAKRLSSRPSS